MITINRKDIIPFVWTPESLKKMRKELGMTQEDVGDILGITKAAVGYIERGQTTSPLQVLAYGIVLERVWALHKGYIHAYRKIGTNEFMEDEKWLSV